jgi:hypothetical protein
MNRENDDAAGAGLVFVGKKPVMKGLLRDCL